jgi:ubiquinone/menaquinone biosynthesis C-methylase UbiE
MRQDAIKIEDARLEGIDLENYPWFNERHRIFPQIFEPGRYKTIFDVAAGIGVVASRIAKSYPCFMLCNDIAKNSLRSLRKNNLPAVSFDLDNDKTSFPLCDASFDAVISLATLEHIINLDKHINELRRILKPGGHLFLSVPNYSSINFVIPYLLRGRTFHDPMKGGLIKYEFYAHVRYFTYKTIIEFMREFGFVAQVTYLPLPKASSRFMRLKKKSRVLAAGFTLFMHAVYLLLPPRWALHPVIRFGISSADERQSPKWPSVKII